MASKRPKSFQLVPCEWAPRLDEALTQAGLSSAQLAREMDLDPSAVSRYRTGQRTPSPPELAYMIRRAGVSADEILGITPPKRAMLLNELEEDFIGHARQVFETLRRQRRRRR
jgi:transcriptional regulator with XRE-family HTH domain